MAFIIADRVKETSTTTGTGALTLAGAITGFGTFASRCSVGDTCYYAIQAVDAGGVPTGDWECGLGTYSASSTLTRTTVTSSSNSDAVVSFAAGTKQVFIALPAVQAKWARERLTADRTYYVRTDGSDSNTGLADSAGGAFLTIQKAVDVVAQLDINIYNVTIDVADGTYNEQVIFKAPLGAGTVTLFGNTATPANCIINATGICLTADGASPVGRVVSGFKLVSTSIGISALNLAVLKFSLLNFGACANYHLNANGGAVLDATGNYTISANAAVHAFIEVAAIFRCPNITVTISGGVSIGSGYAVSRQGSLISAYGMTFSGTFTGLRYECSTNGVIFVNGAATTYFPGSVAGTTATGGQYA